jgi:hypothetical protein
VIAVSQNGLDKVAANLARGRNSVRQETRSAMERVVRTIEADLKGRGLSGAKGFRPLFGVTGAQGDSLGVRSGRTRRSIVARVLDVGPTVIGLVGSPEKYMRAHEEGATIHGGRIPTVNAQTAAGVDRYAGRSIRSIAGAFLFRSRAGNLWGAIRQGGRLVLLFLYPKVIRLRARRVFGKTLERNRGTIRAELTKGAARIVAHANGVS